MEAEGLPFTMKFTFWRRPLTLALAICGSKYMNIRSSWDYWQPPELNVAFELFLLFHAQKSGVIESISKHHFNLSIVIH